MVTAYLALGSNLGDRAATLREGREALDATPGIRVTASSPLYQTEPVGGPVSQGPYLNAAIEVETTLSSHALLRRCLEVEARFGRRRHRRWEARTLDVDLLLFGAEIRDDPELVLPHPRLHLRRFVLVPLRDLAPELLHPVLGRTVAELLADLPPTGGVHSFSETW